MSKRQILCVPCKTIACDTCRKIIVVEPYRIRAKKETGKGIFCSHECQWKSMDVGARVLKTCGHCRKEYLVYRSQVKHRGSKFCSRLCKDIKNGEEHTGKKSSLWRGGVSRAYKTGYWSVAYKRWRKKVFERDNYRCQWCAKRGKQYVQADHIFSFSRFPKKRFLVSNGRTLCISCHKIRTVIQRKAMYETNPTKTP